MRNLLHLLTCTLVSLTAYCQDNYSARLSIVGGLSELGIPPSGEVWGATLAGNTYYTKSVGDLWHAGPFGSLDPFGLSFGKTFERVNFFSEDTLMISGFIQEGNKQDFVLWSGDHGKTWQKIVFGANSWIDAAYVNGNGKAWMSGSSQLIYYTTDKGRTWTSFGKVEPTGNLRFTAIHFAPDEKTGLFGSTWDVLYKTEDNCQHWQKLPTPLNQNKYVRLSSKERPEISKVRIFGDYYIIKQQGRVFISPAATIDWKLLDVVTDFEVTGAGEVYTVNQDLSISLFNAQFVETWRSREKLEAAPRAIGVQGRELYALSFETISRVSPAAFKTAPLLTNDIKIEKPYLTVTYDGEMYGFERRDVLRFDKAKKQWYRFMTLKFPVAHATVFNNQLLIANGMLEQYYALDVKNNAVSPYALPNSLFTGLTVRALHFENGSQGCFHEDNDRKTYVREKDLFVVDKKTGSSKYLSGAPRAIAAAKVDGLAALLDRSRFTGVLLADLGLTDTDVQRFKDFIDKEAQRIKRSGINSMDFDNLYVFPGEQTDFGFYKAVADSLLKLDSAAIDRAFWQAYGNWSTTTVWRRVVLVFDNGQQLVIENADDKPNYLNTPWVVRFDDLKFRSNSVLFGQQVDELTNKQFFLNMARDKNYAIFKIADYLYRKQLAEQ